MRGVSRADRLPNPNEMFSVNSHMTRTNVNDGEGHYARTSRPLKVYGENATDIGWIPLTVALHIEALHVGDEHAGPREGIVKNKIRLACS